MTIKDAVKKKATQAGNWVKEKTKQGIRNKWEDTKYNTRNRWNQAKESEMSPDFLFFLVAIGIHLVDAFAYGFDRGTNSILIMLSLYVALTLFAVLFVYKTGLSSDTWTIAGISLFAFLLPFVTNFFKPDWFIAILIVVPVWGIYLLLNPGDSTFLQKLSKWYFILVLVLGLYVLLTSSLVSTQFTSSQVDVSSAVDVLKHFFVDNTKDLSKSILAFPAKIRSKVNQTFSMSYFTGQVEQNEQEPLGVYLEDLRAMESFFYENNSVIIWATLRGKSFEGIIKVKNYCYINLGGGKRINGEVIPFDPELFYDESRPLECVFKDGLKKGHYTVTFTSTFEFPTWGYVEYTFVDRATRMAYYSQGEDINRELSIPKKSVMIYTNGPVSIGSNIRDMPLVIYPDSNSLQRFGVTIANIWPQGEILTLTNMEIQVPEGIKLDNCIPKPGQTSDGKNGYTIYTFKLESPKEFFTTETCEMNIIDKKNFLKDNLKVTKTFAIKAEYIYSLEKTISIRVEDI